MSYHFEKLIVLFLSIMLTTIACNTDAELSDSGIKVRVDHSVGDSFTYSVDSDKTSFLPYLANEGKYMNENVAIIGKKIDAGDLVTVSPLARFSYTHEQKEHSVIIAIPTAQKYRSIELSSFDDLITTNYAVKHMIEYWYANRFGLGSVSDTSWSVFKIKN